ncbi:hypothetical protein JKP88DRAFT_242563 [Tribonema minus]|uniref:Uncharacterized protein n=1 Tax=Tribonema minus TaxID=303371 RepID=A0A835ZKN5_9STRA|nr:hypothetical protein JKP88DRAFT_242563 [Tribonema minus]
MSTFDAPEATDITALQLCRQYAARELDALREACASKEQEVATLDAAIAQRAQNASVVQDPLQPHESIQTGSQGALHRAQRVVLAAGGGRAAGACAASALSDDEGRPGAAIAQLAASPVQKRPRAVQIQNARPDALQVLTVMVQNRLLPKSAWSMCRSMHRKVRPVARLILREPLLPATSRQAFISNTVIHLQLKGRFDADPLLALSLSPPAPSASSTDRFDSLFKDVTAMTLSNMQGTLTHVSFSLQELHLRACNPMDILPMLRTALRVTDSGPQSDLLTLVKVLLVKRLPDSIGALSALTALDLSSNEELTGLPDSFANLAALTNLDLSYCTTLTSLPESIGRLSALTELVLEECVYLQRLPDSVGDLQALGSLHYTAARD